MNTQHHLRTPEFQPNIPLLDRGFDTKSPDIEDFILSHARAQNEDFYMMEFIGNPNR
jgi:hypothetical protein